MNKQTVYVVHDENGFIKGLAMGPSEAMNDADVSGYNSLELLGTAIQCQHKKCYTDFAWCLLLRDVQAEASTPGSLEDMKLDGEL